MKATIINNPYGGVDWLSTPRVKAVSHEHVYNASTLAKMYDRGIRFFASVHYQPACPRYPFSSFSETYEDWHFFDIDSQSAPAFAYTDVLSARKKIPVKLSGVTTNYRQKDLVFAYTDNAIKKYNKLIRDLQEGETWDECCEDVSAWVELSENEVGDELIKKNKTLEGGFPSFTSKSSAAEWTGISSVSFAGDGETHNSDDFPRIPNAEHPCFGGIRGNHFNVLGTTATEAGWSVGATTNWRLAHVLYNISDINDVFPTSKSFYGGKLFGTLNHSSAVDIFKTIQNLSSWFKGIEVFNNGSSLTDNTGYLQAFHQLLNEGRTAFCVAATDWQGDFRNCSDVDGGTNVLYMPSNYESLSVSDKSKAGMDSYCGGKFVASRFGTKHVVDFSVDENDGIAHFEVSGVAKNLSLVFNGKYVTQHDVSEMSVKIPRGTKNVTGEAWFADGNQQIYKSNTKLADDADFIFTQAIIVETPPKDELDDAMIMFALDN